MTDTTISPAHSAFRVLAALADLGEATAAAVAEKAGLGYSTTTPKLRTWEDTGQAERFRADDGRTLWRLTDAGRAATASSTNTNDGGATPAHALPGDPDPTAAPVVTHRPDPVAEPDNQDHHHPPADPREPSKIDGPTEASPPGKPDAAADLHPAPADAEPQPASGTPTHSGTTNSSEPQDAAGTTPAAARPGCLDDPPAAQPASDTSGGEPDVTTSSQEPAPQRRTPGSLRGAILDICEAHPDQQYKVGELCRLIDQASTGTGTAKASQGAVYNAATKLAAAGTLIQTVEKPATFQLTDSGA